MRQKTALFSHLAQARDYLRYIGLSIQQACEHDRFLLTLPNVVTLLLETSEGRKWIINEHEKIINDLEHRYQTRGIEGFVYEGGFLRWVWWKLFGNEEQHYTSGYQNRIAEIVAHIEEENAENEQQDNRDEVDDQENGVPEVWSKEGNKDQNNDAQAPGKPTANDGFVPPKRWDGEKVKHPKTGQRGWQDKKGKIWVPTGPKGHGGPHWDVQYPNGITYDNVYPGGTIRPGTK